MTVVDDAVVGETPSASPVGSRFGDGFVWYPADDRRGFDPVTDVAIGDRAEVGPEWIAAAVEHCAQGLSMLESLDPAGFDADTVAAWATGVEQLRRQAHAAAIAVTDHLDVAEPFRDMGYFTARAWMKHRLQLSGSEAHGRVQEARLRRAVHGVEQRAGRRAGRRRADPADGSHRRQPADRSRRAHPWRLAADGRRDGLLVHRVRTTSAHLGGTRRSARRRREARTQPSASHRQCPPEFRRILEPQRSVRRCRRPRVPRDLLLVRRPRVRPGLEGRHTPSRRGQRRREQAPPHRSATPLRRTPGDGQGRRRLPARPRHAPCRPSTS